MLQPDVRSAALTTRPEQPSGFIGCRNITPRLIILLSSGTRRFRRHRCTGAKFPCSGSSPVTRFNSAVIPLLFSAVISTVTIGNSSRKYLNQRMFWSWIFAKKRLDRNFFPRNSGIWISSRPAIYPRRAAEKPAVGNGTCSKKTQGSRQPCASLARTGDGHDGRRT